MQCPACGCPEMKQVVYDETVSYGGESIELALMKGEYCPLCGEIVWDHESYDRYFRAQDELIVKSRNNRKQRESPLDANKDKMPVQTTS